jgi:CubicO group peptidase (beta-lactamase class C family)
MTRPPRVAPRLAPMLLLLTTLLAACSPSAGMTGGATHPAATATATSAATGEGSPADTYLSHLAEMGALRGSALVARGGTALLSKGYGVADERSETPNTPHTRFRIGSITKQFTAILTGITSILKSHSVAVSNFF